MKKEVVCFIEERKYILDTSSEKLLKIEPRKLVNLIDKNNFVKAVYKQLQINTANIYANTKKSEAQLQIVNNI